MKLLGQGSGIAAIAVTGIFLFALFNFTVLGIIAAGVGALAWWAITRVPTKHEPPTRKLLVSLFPYESWDGGFEEPSGAGTVDPITACAAGGDLTGGYKDS